MVTDSLGASSESFEIIINVLSPPLVSAICDEEAVLGQELPVSYTHLTLPTTPYV